MTITIDGKGSNVETLPGGEAFEFKAAFTISYSVKGIEPHASFPIVLEFEGELFEIPKPQYVANAIEYHIRKDGLTQATLWDAYYLAREEISVSRLRRENVS